MDRRKDELQGYCRLVGREVGDRDGEKEEVVVVNQLTCLFHVYSTIVTYATC